jgi:hypothetical protein
VLHITSMEAPSGKSRIGESWERLDHHGGPKGAPRIFQEVYFRRHLKAACALSVRCHKNERSEEELQVGLEPAVPASRTQVANEKINKTMKLLVIDHHYRRLFTELR